MSANKSKDDVKIYSETRVSRRAGDLSRVPVAPSSVKSATAIDDINSSTITRNNPSDKTGRDPRRNPVQSLAVVVPCYNETEGVEQLFQSLDILEECLGISYQLEVVLVDDCSSDDTLARLREQASTRAHCKVLTHPRNYGITAAFDTGLRSTKAELVACIDADCTYHPNQLLNLLALLKPGVSVVTASPYHPRGRVEGVVGWRLVLSKSASWLYSHLFSHKLHTYTSCFRVYRRADMLRISPSDPGFVGITEILWKLDQLNLTTESETIVEAPATLRRRQTGVSKMSVLKTGVSHLKLMTRISLMRLRGSCKSLLSGRQVKVDQLASHERATDVIRPLRVASTKSTNNQSGLGSTDRPSVDSRLEATEDVA